MTLQERLVRYFRKHPGQRFAKSYLIDLAVAKMKVSPESVGRRLRVLAEVSEWGYRPNIDSPEHETGAKLLDGGKLEAERIGGLVHYRYQPPRTRKYKRVEVIDGIAYEREVEEEVIN